MWEDQLSRYIDELENEAYALSPEERAYFSFRPLALPTALTDRIPTEIYEIVIDSMDAGPMLAAAALVCTAWYPRAMYNLYHAIELRDRTSFTLLSKQYRTSPRVRKWLATTRELYAADRHNQIHDPSPQSKRTERGYFHVFPLTIGHVMYGLQNLTIKNFNSGTMPLTAFAALSRISSLKSLTLAYCMFSNISQLRRIICAFPQLQSLRLGDIFMVQRYAASTAGVDSTHPQSDVRLQNLAIGLNDTGASGTVIDWMLASGICTSLRRLSVWSVDPDGYVMEHVDRLLAATGPSITEYFEDLPLNR
ncbi:hypothetical protein EVJ58_g4396 [Rhodofomes roseus]|uniref:F-box domain-containing protein n=1 Tax=Rhodofomes roseus TaxID=34475 RepID=A0A4Y9YHL5_9APHY|nr:hypothetical protein EVJ58_g4396 [Rhodofomes roseus]